MNDWQSGTAIGIVCLTVLAFVIRAKRKGKKKSGGCKSKGCGQGRCG
jgi:hypothetical protein